MLERVLITGLLALGCVGLFMAFRAWNISRASQAARAGRAASAGDATRGGRPALLYFRSDQCAPCVAQWRFVQQVQAQFESRVTVEKIDADVEHEKANRYGVITLPTTLVIDGSGTVRHINYGLTDARKLALQLQSVV